MVFHQENVKGRTLSNEWAVKQVMIDIGRRLWTKDFVASNDGNLSVRLDANAILTTPTGVSKGFMTPDMILKVDMEGNPISSSRQYKPSSEVKMHLEVYRQRADIHSVIHAHPPYCTSFAVAGIPLNKCVLPEAVLSLGAVPIAPYGTPSTQEIPDSIKPFVPECDAILLANHGALTFGVDPISAYHRMETLEHSAHIVFISIQLGNVNMIPADEVEKLMEVRQKMNIPGRVSACGTVSPAVRSVPLEKTVETITKTVIERLKKENPSMTEAT